jgi:erythronate-4-phosphate dehydrogenase
VTPPAPSPISWEEVQNSIDSYCNLQAETEALRSHPECFEALRDGYAYREEFF